MMVGDEDMGHVAAVQSFIQRGFMGFAIRAWVDHADILVSDDKDACAGKGKGAGVVSDNAPDQGAQLVATPIFKIKLSDKGNRH